MITFMPIFRFLLIVHTVYIRIQKYILEYICTQLYSMYTSQTRSKYIRSIPKNELATIYTSQTTFYFQYHASVLSSQVVCEMYMLYTFLGTLDTRHLMAEYQNEYFYCYCYCPLDWRYTVQICVRHILCTCTCTQYVHMSSVQHLVLVLVHSMEH